MFPAVARQPNGEGFGKYAPDNAVVLVSGNNPQEKAFWKESFIFHCFVFHDCSIDDDNDSIQVPDASSSCRKDGFFWFLSQTMRMI